METVMKMCALGALLIVSIPVVGTADQTNTVRMAESGIRRVATSKPMPVYPAESRARKAGGVAVAAIVSGEDGRVTTVSVLEAPDAAIGAAVRDALLKWEIPAMTVTGRPERYGVRGKVTFYFQAAGGRVANPENLPGGPKPEPAAGPPTAAPGARAGGPPAAPRAAPGIVQHDDSAVAEIGEAELRQLLASARPIVLDVREREDFKRGHRAGAVNIPRDELAIRAYIEIERARPVVIDCSQAETRECRMAANLLLWGPKVARVMIFLP
jgi:TonB family protein